ncbi:MAG: hypothetical protein QXW05_01465 [Ignisphaera sp.]
MNRVFIVEKFIYRVKYEKYEPSEDEIRFIGWILGQPTKKLDVIFSRYEQLFNRYVEKRCTKVDGNSICIYSWNQKTPFKVFPLTLHLYGTVILFSDNEPKEVLAYPIPKALSYAKSPGVPQDEYCDRLPVEVTRRVDGWQVTAYFNPVMNRWIFATRYVLHNMYFERGRLVIESIDSIANPYVYVADRIAQEENVYKSLDRFRGWTFTFVLEGPEPAITKPPYPLGEDYRRYKLYILMARDPNGRLYTWSETSRLIPYRSPEYIEPKPLNTLYEEVLKRVETRSYFAYIATEDPENPMVIELESEVYPEAMYVKYLYDAKSAALLITENITDKLIEIIDDNAAKAVIKMKNYIDEFSSILSSIDIHDAHSFAWKIVKVLSEHKEHVDISVEELTKILKERNMKRALRKVLSILLENSSLISKETFENLGNFINNLKKQTLYRHNIHG